MVINAHCKLEQFSEEHPTSASERVKKVRRLMSELVTEIFFVPENGYVNLAATLPLPQLPTLPVPTAAGVNPSQAAPVASLVSQPQIEGYSEATDPTVEDGLRGEAEAPETPTPTD